MRVPNPAHRDEEAQGSPLIGRSPSRSTASAGGNAPQLVAGPVCRGNPRHQLPKGK